MNSAALRTLSSGPWAPKWGNSEKWPKWQQSPAIFPWANCLMQLRLGRITSTICYSLQKAPRRGQCERFRSRDRGRNLGPGSDTASGEWTCPPQSVQTRRLRAPAKPFARGRKLRTSFLRLPMGGAPWVRDTLRLWLRSFSDLPLGRGGSEAEQSRRKRNGAGQLSHRHLRFIDADARTRVGGGATRNIHRRRCSTDDYQLGTFLGPRPYPGYGVCFPLRKRAECYLAPSGARVGGT